jgi:TP901 family phage tail tape measure protein
MAKKISSRDIFDQEDIFKGIRDSAKQTITMMNNLQKEVMETADALKKSIGGAKFDSAKAIKNVVDVTSKANKLKKESIQIDKLKKDAMIKEAKALQELEKIEQQKLKTQSQQMRNDKQQRQEKERLQKINQKAVKTAQDEANAYKKLAKNTRDLKNESKRLGAELLLLEQSGKKNTKAYRDLSNQYKKVTASAKQGDQALKKLDKSVGDNFRNVGNYKDAIKGLVGVLGTLGAGIGLGQIFRNVTGVMMDFDQAQADLTAISGKTKDELSGLTAQAKELGATTQFTATEITSLQIELAKLGFTTEEISASTEAVSNFASATGSDLASASKVAGSTLRAFGLDASEMERVVSTLGVATTKSALSFSTFETAMSTIAPVSATFGFSVEETTALLGTLADAGFDASSSATATRNILLNLADANGDLAKEIGRPITGVEDLADAFGELEDKGIDLGKALELTDKRSVGAFLQIVKGSDKLVQFKDSITDVNDELEDMAEKKLDSVRGQVTLLGSAWEGFILGLDDSAGASETLKEAIGFLARNLSTILGLVFKVIKAFVVYKTTMIALNTIQFITNTSFKELGLMIAKLIPGTKAYTLQQKHLARASNEVAVGTQRMGKAMKNVPYLLVIGLAIDFAMALWEGVDASAELQRQEELRAQQAKDNKAEFLEFSEERKKVFDENIEKLIEENDLEKALGKNKNKQASLDVKLAKQKVDLVDQNIAQLEKLIEREEDQIDKEIDRIAFLISQGIIRNKQYDIESDTHVKRIRASQEQARLDIEAFKKLRETFEIKKKTIEEENKGKGTERTKSLNTELKQSNEYLSQQIKLLQELQKIEQERDLLSQQRDIDAEFNKQIENIKKTGEFDADQLNQLIDEKVETETRYIEQRTEFAKQSRLDQYEFEKKAREQALKDERDALLKKAIDDQEAQDKINANYQTRLTELSNEEIDRKADVDLELEVMEEEKVNKILKIQEEGYKSSEDLLEQFTDEVSSYDQKQIERTKETQKTIKEIVKGGADYFIQQSQRKIDQINKEIAKATEQYDYFKQLAVNGNIDAKESLAEQQKIINEANKKKLEEEKKQQRIRMAESVFNTYSSKVESGSKNPLAETIRDTSLLLQFINSIPAFFDGTEDTGSNGQGVDGRGGFHAVLHPNERVVPKSLNQQIGDLTNEELTKIAVDYKNGRVVEGATQMTSSMDLAILVNELTDIKKTIENKPETNIELGEITQSMMEVVKSTRKGNTIVYNRYKIKK